MSKYLVYGLVDPRTHHLRYVGKSESGSIRPRQHVEPARLVIDHTHKGNWLRRLLAEGLKPEIVVIQEFDDNEILGQAEIFWIAYFKRLGHSLTNHCRGGEGFIGPHTSETKAKIGAAHRGRKRSQETKDRMRAKALGRIHTQESKDRMSRAKRGSVVAFEVRERIAASLRNWCKINRTSERRKTQTEE